MFNKLELVNAFNDHCEYKFYTVGVCSSAILISVTDQQEVFNVEFIGGCPGNGKAVSLLVEGMKLEEVVGKLRGVKCCYHIECRRSLDLWNPAVVLQILAVIMHF